MLAKAVCCNITRTIVEIILMYVSPTQKLVMVTQQRFRALLGAIGASGGGETLLP